MKVKVLKKGLSLITERLNQFDGDLVIKDLTGSLGDPMFTEIISEAALELNVSLSKDDKVVLDIKS